jgi:hypothetical protein
MFVGHGQHVVNCFEVILKNVLITKTFGFGHVSRKIRPMDISAYQRKVCPDEGNPYGLLYRTSKVTCKMLESKNSENLACDSYSHSSKLMFLLNKVSVFPREKRSKHIAPSMCLRFTPNLTLQVQNQM